MSTPRRFGDTANAPASVGIVVVSHSRKLAEGVVELAREMAGPDVRLAAAGGVGADAHALGTDVERIATAIQEVYAAPGVVVLLDVGSAILSAEMAVEAGPPEWRGCVVLCDAPLVEGAVAAAVQARLGASLDQVVAEARRALDPKVGQLRGGKVDASSPPLVVPPEAGSSPSRRGDAAARSAAADATFRRGPEAVGAPPTTGTPSPARTDRFLPGRTYQFVVGGPHGLHARPAAKLVEVAGGFRAEVSARNLTTGAGPASARSLVGLSSLGALAGHRIEVSATGPEAEAAIDAIEALVRSAFSEPSRSPGAEVVATPARPSGEEPAPPGGGRRREAASAPSALLRGRPASPGVARGVARHRRAIALDQSLDRSDVPEPSAATGPADEWRTLADGIARARAEIEAFRDALAARGERGAAEVIATELLYLDDPAILERARRDVFAGSGAAAAWRAAIAETTGAYRSLDDAYLRARAEDVADVGRRVLAALTDRAAPGPTSVKATGNAPCVLVVDDLGPSDVAALDRSAVRAICAARGGPTSHAAILARGLGIPAVVGLGKAILDVPEGTPLLVDGAAGLVRVDPDPSLREAFGVASGAGPSGFSLTEAGQLTRPARVDSASPQEVGRRGGRGKSRAGFHHAPSGTSVPRPSSRLLSQSPTDHGPASRSVSILANVAGVEDAREARAAGAEGVGLLRTEFLFPGRARAPTEDEQVDLYRAVAAALDGGTVTIRTLDAGGDKPLPYLDVGREENPALGRRAIRASLACPDLFSAQLRAIARVAADHPVRVMFPLVSTLDEWRQARHLLDEATRDVRGRGLRVPDGLPAGVMVETPAAALIADQFAAEVDFFSLGTNDLAQYTLAADRGNSAVAALADPLHPAVLRLIRLVVEAARRRGLTVSVCGEVASDPAAVPVLLDLGVDALSVHPGAVAAVRAAVNATLHSDRRGDRPAG